MVEIFTDTLIPGVVAYARQYVVITAPKAGASRIFVTRVFEICGATRRGVCRWLSPDVSHGRRQYSHDAAVAALRERGEDMFRPSGGSDD